jgi:hypothetical protein
MGEPCRAHGDMKNAYKILVQTAQRNLFFYSTDQLEVSPPNWDFAHLLSNEWNLIIVNTVV